MPADTMLKKTICIYPNFDILYHGYFLFGLRRHFENRNIKYACDSLPAGMGNGLAFLVLPNGPKVFIDTEDWHGIDNAAIDWCDVYGKVNVDWREVAGGMKSKVVPIGPTFGIRLLNRRRALVRALSLMVKHGRRIGDKRKFVRDHWRQAAYRLPIEAYRPSDSGERYVFCLSRTWAPEDRCNLLRIRFLKAARSVQSLDVEGGFVPPLHPEVAECKPFSVPKWYPIVEYIQKTQQSFVVFNTPAVLDCHSWKFGEYLALGKAILSTPLKRELPAPLEHGRHIHFVGETIEEMREGIEFLRTRPVYRRSLEREARHYFEEYLTPEGVIGRLLSNWEEPT